MKRLVGYITLVLSMLLALLVGLVPSLINVNGTGDYESMHQYVYKISEKNYDVSGGGTSDDGNISDNQKQDRLDEAVEAFKDRLDQADIVDYQLETSGLDTIIVSFKADSSLYDDVASLLSFSWSFKASTYTGDPAVGQDAVQISTNSGNDNFFDAGSARIEYRNNYPYVVIPLKDPEAFKQVYVAARDAESSSTSTGEEEGETTTANENKIFILNDWLNGLTLESLLGSDLNEFVQGSEIKDYVLFDFDTSDPSSFYWDYDSTLSSSDQENAVYEEIYFGGYDLTGGDSSYYGNNVTDRILAYRKANIWLAKFNSTTFDFNVTLINVNGTNNVEEIIPPFNDYLVFMNEINWSNGLFIASLIGLIVVSLFFVLNNGINGVSSILTLLGVFISSIGLFNAFGGEFNIGAILGILTLVMISIFLSTHYFKCIKDEIYLGKNMRKAYQDGGKKSFMPLFDTTIISLILGITAYLIPNTIMISFGSILVIGSIVNVILNGFILRPLSWLIYNSSVIQNNQKLIMVDKKFVPNLSMDEKPTYFKQFDKNSSKKGRTILLIASTIVLLASVIGITTFQVVRGNIYNDSSNVNSTQIVIRIDERNVYEDDSLYITNYSEDIENVFTTRLYRNENTLLVRNVEIKNYNYSFKNNNVINKEYYFVIDLNGTYDSQDTVYVLETSGNFRETTLEEAVNIEIMNVVPASEISVNQVVDVRNDSNNYYALIYCLIGIAVTSLYILVRFNVSKMLSSILVLGGSLTMTVGIFVLVNGTFASTITLGTMMLLSLGYMMLVLYFNKEKETLKERRSELKDVALRRDAYEISTNNTYMYIINATILTSFAVISLFFATSIDQYLLMLMIVGMIILILTTKFASLSIESFLSKMFNSWRVSISNSVEERRKKKGKDKKKKNDDGPEEAIFVGIND